MILFTKMHGAGNDFVIIRDEDSLKVDYSEMAIKMCHRQFGIGADGLMIVKKSEVADIRMIYYNSDGSIAEMCGNGIRCFSNYVFENNIVTSKEFSVETMAGIKNIKVEDGLPNQRLIGVEMGKVQLNSINVPVKTTKKQFLNEEIFVNGRPFILSSVRMGVPHTIVITEKLEDVDVVEVGSQIETMDLFPMKTNVNFVEVLSKNHIKVDTWERGAGHTLACGTGVCSAVYIAHENGLTADKVKVDVPGGSLHITLNDEGVYMEGQAVFICEGQFIEN